MKTKLNSFFDIKIIEPINTTPVKPKEPVAVKFTDNEKKVIRKFIDGEKAEYKLIEKYFEKCKDDKSNCLYVKYLISYFSDDYLNMSKYKNEIMGWKRLKKQIEKN